MQIEIDVTGPKVGYNMKIDTNYKISVVRGWSATGKTTLCNYINLANTELEGYELKCSKKCMVVSQPESFGALHDAIVFIDEVAWDRIITDRGKLETKEIIENSSNYFVIMTRDSHEWLRLDVNAIYEIKECGTKGRVTLNRVVSVR